MLYSYYLPEGRIRTTQNGGATSNGKMWDQFLNGELFYTLKEAQILTERWGIHYNTIRPHRSLGGQPPAPQSPPACELKATSEGGTKTPGW